eukprot:gene4185-3023_t
MPRNNHETSRFSSTLSVSRVAFLFFSFFFSGGLSVLIRRSRRIIDFEHCGEQGPYPLSLSLYINK